MPHLTILYTPNLDGAIEDGGADIQALCNTLAETMAAQRDEALAAVFPIGGIRVLAYPASHYAIADGGAAGRAADGTGEYAFVYLNLRVARGRSAAVLERTGRALDACIKHHFEGILTERHIGVTLQIDEGDEVFNARTSSLHPLFARD